jgi:hypothetical protein
MSVYRYTFGDGDLSFEDFILLSQHNCIYCDIPPSNRVNQDATKKPEGLFIYNGVDRIDSSMPHNLNNVVPCCRTCNFAKSNHSLAKFVSYITTMYEYRLSQWDGNYLNIKIPTLGNNLPPIKILHPVPEILDIGAKFGFMTIIDKAYKKSWICRCLCGTEKTYMESDIKGSGFKSCGHYECASHFGGIRIAALRSAWYNYKADGLLFEEFYELSQMNCFYCGIEPSNKIPSQSIYSDETFTYSGLDRIDSSEGHIINNLVPCCIICNRMKNKDLLSDFDQWLTKVFNRIDIFKNIDQKSLNQIT